MPTHSQGNRDVAIAEGLRRNIRKRKRWRRRNQRKIPNKKVKADLRDRRCKRRIAGAERIGARLLNIYFHRNVATQIVILRGDAGLFGSIRFTTRLVPADGFRPRFSLSSLALN